MALERPVIALINEVVESHLDDGAADGGGGPPLREESIEILMDRNGGSPAAAPDAAAAVVVTPDMLGPASAAMGGGFRRFKRLARERSLREEGVTDGATLLVVSRVDLAQVFRVEVPSHGMIRSKALFLDMRWV